MPLELIEEKLNGVKLFSPKVFGDNRGWFTESYRKDDLEKHGISVEFIQDNHSMSTKGVLRGMHFQHSPPQDKLIRVTKGIAQVVEVDIRLDSPTFGQWVGAVLSAESKAQLWIPEGFAHGFLTLSSVAEVQYKARGFWNKDCEHAIRWNDSTLAIDWPQGELNGSAISLSEKDAEAPDLISAQTSGDLFP